MIQLKLRFLLAFIVLLTLGQLFISCDNSETNEVIQEIETPDRAVLLYIIGDNTLSNYADRNIDSIMSGMSRMNTTLEMLVYQDSQERLPVIWKIRKGKNGKVQKDIVREFTKEQDSADPSVMESVIREVFDTYPTREKGLILWSHGSGWLPSPYFGLQEGMQRAFGPDRTTYLELWDIREVLENTGVHFDFICFDACLMACAEVAYELKDLTDYLILSPTEIMGVGFPYQTIVPVLGRTVLDLKDVCRAYMDFFNGIGGRDGTISLVQTAYLDDLASCYGKILQQTSLPEALHDRIIQQMGRRIPLSATDYRGIFYDMGDVVVNLVSPFYSEFDGLMNKVVLFKDNTERFATFDIIRNSGLTVFIPELSQNDFYLQAYPLLRWYKATR